MGILQQLTKPVEKLPHYPGLRQGILEKPDGFGIWDFIAKPKTKKPHKAEAVIDLVFRLVVTEVIQPLKKENFKHENAVKSRSASRALGFPSGFLKGMFYDGAEYLPVNDWVDAFQCIAHLTQPAQPVFHIKESQLHPPLPPETF